MPQPVYVDTSAFYALIDRSDSYHAPASLLWEALLDEDTFLLTSSYVVSETMNLMQYRLGFEAANLWHKAVLEVVDIYWVDKSIHQHAHELWMRLGRRRCSLVDCASYVIMYQNQVETAFCFKANYADHGYALIPGERSHRLGEAHGQKT